MEKKNTKLFMRAAVIALLTLAGGSLYAEPALFTSPQKTATATQFWSDADLFLSPSGYTAVEFDKFFGAVSFQSNFPFQRPNGTLEVTAQKQMMQLGFATQFGGLYTALYYGGNTLALPNEDYSEIGGKRVYKALPDLFWYSGNRPYNEASVLIGVADMGIRLSYVHSYRSNKLNDFYLYSVDDDHYKSFTDEHGSINPQIAWGMAKELIPGVGLQPHLYVDVDFFRDYQKADTGSGDEIDHSNNEFSLGVTAAIGYISLFKQNGFDFSVDLWYTGNFKTFNNEYTPSAGKIVTYTGKYQQVGTMDNPDDPLVDDYYRVGYNDHSLTPYLCASWSGDRLMLAAEFGLGLGLVSEKGTQFDLNGNAPKKEGFDFKAIAFSFNPNLDLGLQWAIVPDKFYLNAGSSIKFLDLGLTTSTYETYANDIKTTAPTEKEVDKTFGGAETSLKLGFTFNPTANLGIQAMSGIDISTNNVNVFSTSAATGLAVFSKIMVTLKF